MPSSVPDVKDGFADYLGTWEGLRREPDGVTVNSAPVAPSEVTDKDVTLGDVTAPRSRAGLAATAEAATLTGWIGITKPGGDEDARRAARREAYALLALVEQAIKADPTAQGTVPPPGGMALGESALEEFPTDPPPGGSAGRRANLRFTVTWTSHLF